MKTSQKDNFFKRLFKSEKPIVTRKQNANDDLIVIRDTSNGKYYYLSVVDTFFMEKYEYVVVYNYEPDDGEHRKPELVIMRTEFQPTGEQLFYSIKDSTELNDAFDAFMRRYYDAGNVGKQHTKSAKLFVNPSEVGYRSEFVSKK